MALVMGHFVVHLEILEKKISINAEVQDCLKTANVMVHERVLGKLKIRHLALCILLVSLTTEVVNLDLIMITFEIFDDLFSFVSVDTFFALSWKAHCNYVISYVSHVQVKSAITSQHPSLLL